MNYRFVWIMVALILVGHWPVHAYKITNRCLGSNEPNWGSDRHPIYELTCSPNGFPGLPRASTTYGTPGYTDARESMRSALWMWIREGTSSAWLYEDSSRCLSGPEDGAWFDGSRRGSGGTSEFWWEPQEVVNRLCDGSGGTIGCASQQYRCNIRARKRRVHASDIAVSNTTAWAVVWQNSLRECLDSGLSMSNTWLHEIGHSYTIGHEDRGGLTVMRSNITPARNCHVAQGYVPYPFPDDINALMDEHRGYSKSNPPVNYAGTAFYTTGSEPTIARNRLVWSGSSSRTLFLPMTLHTYYPPAPTRMYFRLVLIPDGSAPTFDWSERRWRFPDRTHHEELRFAAFTNVRDTGFSAYTPVWESVLVSRLSKGTYRVWVHVDPDSYTIETDEGDNVFPTDVVIERN